MSKATSGIFIHVDPRYLLLMVLPAMPPGRAKARPMTSSASSGDGGAVKFTQTA